MSVARLVFNERNNRSVSFEDGFPKYEVPAGVCWFVACGPSHPDEGCTTLSVCLRRGSSGSIIVAVRWRLGHMRVDGSKLIPKVYRNVARLPFRLGMAEA